MKKLLFITPKYYLGGAELQMRFLVKEGIKLGKNITVLDIETSEEIKDKGLNIIQLKKEFLYMETNKYLRIIKRLRRYWEIGKIIKKEDFDFVIFFNLNLLPLVFFTKAKFIYSVREFNPIIFKTFMKIFLKKLYLITTNNIPSYIFLKKNYRNVYLQNNVVESERKEKKKLTEIKRSYLIISNISKRKNLESAIKAFKELKDYGYKLRIAGKIVDENYYYKLKKEIIGYENIEFLGYLNQENLYKEYKAAEGVIHLSKMEGTPNAILDAIKFNKKFICLETPENIALFSEVPVFLIANEKKLKNKLLEFDHQDCHQELEYLNFKIKLLFSKKNIQLFYKKIES